MRSAHDFNRKSFLLAPLCGAHRITPTTSESNVMDTCTLLFSVLFNVYRHEQDTEKEIWNIKHWIKLWIIFIIWRWERSCFWLLASRPLNCGSAGVPSGMRPSVSLQDGHCDENCGGDDDLRPLHHICGNRIFKTLGKTSIENYPCPNFLVLFLTK